MTLRPEFCKLFGSVGITKEIGLMLLVVSPDVVLAVGTPIAIIVWVAPVLLHIVNEFSVYYASAGDRITTIIAHKCVGVLNAFLWNYLAHF